MSSILLASKHNALQLKITCSTHAEYNLMLIHTPYPTQTTYKLKKKKPRPSSKEEMKNLMQKTLNIKIFCYI
jgi:hypothetical protein